MTFATRNTCRMCGSPAFRDLLSLGNLCVSGFPADGGDDPPVPLELVLCDPGAGGCGLVQLRHTVNADLMYRHYWYRSFTNESMRVALAEITARAEALVDLKPGDLVLDVGCNDGTLLRSYRPQGIRLCGFEPARNLLTFARQGTDTIVNDFFNADAFERAFGATKARALTTIAMFYDLEDPNGFVSDVARVLDNGGIWINQMASLPLMLELNAFDNICHEHLEYYSLSVLAALYARHGLEIFDVETNDVNGGSFRVFAQKKNGPHGTPFSRGRVEGMLQFERSVGFHTVTPYLEFAARIGERKDQLLQLLRTAKAQGKKVYGYGASTKGNTLLQHYGIGPDLVPAIAERNSEKWGRKTAGSQIPIISEEQARAERPDYFLALPWHFIRSFRERERDFLSAGGRFIVPLPDVKIVGP